MDTILKYKVQAFTKEDAFDLTPIDKSLFGYMKNISIVYKRAGCPSGKDLDAFLQDYIISHRCLAGYIVIAPGNKDRKVRPYTLYNNPPAEKRVFQLRYEVVPAKLDVPLDHNNKLMYHDVHKIVKNQKGDVVNEVVLNIPTIDVIATGLPMNTVDTMGAAKVIMKQLIVQTHHDYFIREIKIPLDTEFNQEKTCFGKYSPSKGSIKGTYIFFVKENQMSDNNI